MRQGSEDQAATEGCSGQQLHIQSRSRAGGLLVVHQAASQPTILPTSGQEARALMADCDGRQGSDGDVGIPLLGTGLGTSQHCPQVKQDCCQAEASAGTVWNPQFHPCFTLTFGQAAH